MPLPFITGQKTMYKWCAAFPGREAVEKGFDASFFKNYREVRELFCIASDFCHKDIAKLCYDTVSIDYEWQTVCLLTHCYALYQIVKAKFGTPDCTAGYSQGEFTACVAAGVFPFPEILDLIHRLELLVQGSQTGREGMYRIIDIAASSLEEICRQVDETGKYVSVSAYLSDTQNVISGKWDFVERVIDKAKQSGARWAIPLKAERAFHCCLCDIPADKSARLFYEQSVNTAQFPVYSCYDGEASTDSEIIKRKLSKQLNHPLLWKALITNMADAGITHLIENGPGCTVSANSRIADGRMSCRWIGSTSEL